MAHYYAGWGVITDEKGSIVARTEGLYKEENGELFAKAEQMEEVLQECRTWFRKYNPSVKGPRGNDEDHPLLTKIKKVLDES